MNIKEIALSKQYKKLINKKVKYIGNQSNELETNKIYTIDTINKGYSNTYVTLKEIKTFFDIPFNIDQFELIQEPEQTKQPKQNKLIKFAMLFVLLISVFTSNHTYAAVTKKGIQSSKAGHHTIIVLHKVIKPKTIKYKPYKQPKQHITKVKSYKIKHIAIVHPTIIHTSKIHYPKIKMVHISTIHHRVISTFHPAKIHLVHVKTFHIK